MSRFPGLSCVAQSECSDTFADFGHVFFSISIMNFKNKFLRGDLWIKNVNYFLGISVQSLARTKTVHEFTRCSTALVRNWGTVSL